MRLRPIRPPSPLPRCAVIALSDLTSARAPHSVSLRWIRQQFERTDDGAAGKFHTLRRGIKFAVRCLLYAKALHVVDAALHSSRFGPLVERDPYVALRPLRSYLRHGLSGVQRARAVQLHFSWLRAQIAPAVVESLCAGEALPLLAPEALPGAQIWLSVSGGLGREGELSLNLYWQGQRVMAMAFSVLDAPESVCASVSPGPRAVVGVLQGVRGTDEVLRSLGASAQRLRPHALMLASLQGLCTGWNLQAPLGVAPGAHVYAGYTSRRRKVGLNYASTWQEAGGLRVDDHYWLLPALPLLRPEAEVESRKRAQHRRRNTLRQGLFDSARDSMQSLLTAKPGRP